MDLRQYLSDLPSEYPLDQRRYAAFVVSMVQSTMRLESQALDINAIRDLFYSTLPLASDGLSKYRRNRGLVVDEINSPSPHDFRIRGY